MESKKLTVSTKVFSTKQSPYGFVAKKVKEIANAQFICIIPVKTGIVMHFNLVTNVYRITIASQAGNDALHKNTL